MFSTAIVVQQLITLVWTSLLHAIRKPTKEENLTVALIRGPLLK